MDVNGDGFPDQLTTKKFNGRGVYVEFTNPLGGVLNKVHIDSSQYSIAKSVPQTDGVSVSGVISKTISEGTRRCETKGINLLTRMFQEISG